MTFPPRTKATALLFFFFFPYKEILNLILDGLFVFLK